MVDPRMILLCIVLIGLGIIGIINEFLYVRDWPEPVEASSASGNLAELVVLR